MMIKLSILLGVVAATVAAADFPQAEISNGHLKAKLYLPDAQRGYYQATRFDWSGVIASLEYKGHNYFGVWFDKYDPKINDAITGPVEEFLTNGMGLGYDDVASVLSQPQVFSSSPRTVQPSASSKIQPLPAAMIGSMVITRPSVSFSREWRSK